MDPTKFFAECNATLLNSGVDKATAFDDDFVTDTYNADDEFADEFGDAAPVVNQESVANIESVEQNTFSRMIDGIYIPEETYEIKSYADFVKHTVVPGDYSRLCESWNSMHGKAVATEEEVLHDFAVTHNGIVFGDFPIGHLSLDLIERLSPSPCVITEELIAEVNALPDSIDSWQYLVLRSNQDSKKLIEFMQSQAYNFDVAVEYAKQGDAALTLFMDEVLQNDGMIFTVSEKELMRSAIAMGIEIERTHLKRWKELSILESVLKYQLAGGDSATVLRLEEAPKWLVEFYQTHTISGGLLDAVVKEDCEKYFCELPEGYNTEQLFSLVNAYYSGKLDECTYQQYLFSLQFKNASVYEFTNTIPQFNKYWMDCICKQTGLRVQSLDGIGDTIVVLDERVRCISLYEYLAGAITEDLSTYNAKFLNDNKGIILFNGQEDSTIKYAKMYLYGNSTMAASAMATSLNCPPIYYNVNKLKAYLHRVYPDFNEEHLNGLYTDNLLQAMRNDKVLRYVVHYAPELMDVFAEIDAEDIIAAMKSYVHLGNKTIFKMKFLHRLLENTADWQIPSENYRGINLDKIVVYNGCNSEISWEAFCCALGGYVKELDGRVLVCSENGKLCLKIQ